MERRERRIEAAADELSNLEGARIPFRVAKDIMENLDDVMERESPSVSREVADSLYAAARYFQEQDRYYRDRLQGTDLGYLAARGVLADDRLEVQATLDRYRQEVGE